MPNLLEIGVNDLETWCQNNNKKLLSEWNYKKNGEKTPQNVMCGSGYKAWWICSKGHNYQTAIYNRAKKNGTGCPICSNRQILVGYNDLLTTHPQLAKEWHPTKNGNLTPEMVTAGSLKKVWWFLPYYDNVKDKVFDFEWEATVSNRALKNSGCPFLNGTVWTGYNDL